MTRHAIGQTVQRRDLLGAGSASLGLTAGCADSPSDVGPAQKEQATDDGPAQQRNYTSTIEAYGVDGQFRKQYDVSNYADVLAAAGQIQDDLPPTGGTIVLPHGVYRASTQLHIYKPLTIKTPGGNPSRWSQDLESAHTRIEWDGGSTTAILVQATGETPTPVLSGIELSNLYLRPADRAGGDRAVHVDARETPVRSIRFEQFKVTHWGGENAAIECEGNQFAVYADYLLGEENYCTVFSSTAPDDPASEHQFFAPQMLTKEDYWGLDLDTNSYAIFGGNFQNSRESEHRHGGNGVRITGAGNGAIYGTKFEAHSVPDKVAIKLVGPSRYSNVQPAHVAKWGTGIQVGDSDAPRKTTNVTIDAQFKDNLDQDVLIDAGGQRENLTIECPTPNGITDNRNLKAKDRVIYGNGAGSHGVGNSGQRPSPGEVGARSQFATVYDAETQAAQRSWMGWEDGEHWYSMTPVWGSFTGDGSGSKTIALNFRPGLVVVSNQNNAMMAIQGADYATTLEGQGSGSLSITEEGFEVGGAGFPNPQGSDVDFLAR
jgi:hypothetical protein